MESLCWSPYFLPHRIHYTYTLNAGVAGACESIPVILQAHPTSEYVACAGCDVISFMSEVSTNGFAARFGQAGGYFPFSQFVCS